MRHLFFSVFNNKRKKKKIMGNYLCCCRENEEKGELFVPMEVKYWNTIPPVIPWSRPPTPIFMQIEGVWSMDNGWSSPTLYDVR
jgi:hypothetical protein